MAMDALQAIFPLWCGDDASDDHIRAKRASPSLERTREQTRESTPPASGPHAPSEVYAERQRQGLAILAALRDGQVELFEAFFVSEYASLVDFATSITNDRASAEDVVADVFLWIYHHRASVSPSGTLIAYVMGAVRHKALDVMRSRRRETERHARLGREEHWSVMPAHVKNPETETIGRETTAALHATVMASLAQCTPSSRTAFLLRVRKGLSFAEISQVLGISENAAKKQVGRVVQVLRETIPELID